ncbi:MAG TPA: response regulator [Kofleriaceae bacterium]|nr:response regulator [Kofleriaceae bacterium]
MLLKKIVVAEDDDAIAHMVNMALGDAGFLCLRARDGDEALRLVRAHDPDLLVLDVMMPRVDGYEVARRLKSDVMWSRTPILMLTALAGVDNQVEGLEAGADAYMTKPFDLREFAAQVKALIRTARRERDRNPTTDLPGSRAIDAELEEVLKRGPASVLHIDLYAFDGYADAVGFARAEETVRALAKLILDEARAVTSGGAFVGHIGGADFIAVVAQAQAETLAGAIVDGFEAQRAAVAPGDEGKQVAVVIAVASTDGLGTGGIDELGRRLGKSMKAAKAAAKSGYVIWTA